MPTAEAKAIAKLTAKLGREPNDAELQAYKEKRAARKAAMQDAEAAPPAPPADPPAPPDAAPPKQAKKTKSTAAPAADAPAAAAAAPAVAPAPPATAPQRKKKRSEGEQPPSQPPPALRAAAPAAQSSGPSADALTSTLVNSSRIAAQAAITAIKGTNGSLSNDAFKKVWDEHRRHAEELVDDSMRPPAMADAAWAELQKELRTTLVDALTTGEQMLAKCEQKAAKGKAQKKQAGGGKRGRPPKVKDDVLESGLEKLKIFKYDIYDATRSGASQYLSVDELKQVAIHKDVYQKDFATKMDYIKALANGNCFREELKKANAAAAEVLTAEDDDDDDDDDGS